MNDFEPPLKDVYLEQAAEIWHLAYQQALDAAGFQAARPTWEETPTQEREAIKQAVKTLLNWNDQ